MIKTDQINQNFWTNKLGFYILKEWIFLEYYYFLSWKDKAWQAWIFQDSQLFLSVSR